MSDVGSDATPPRNQAMKVTYESGVFSFDFAALLDQLNPNDKRALADHLACEDAIIDDVAAQIISGWTEAGSHGSKYATAEPEPTTGLAKAWRDVAKASGDVARKQIESLEDALQRKTEQVLQLERELRDLQQPQGTDPCPP